MAVIVLRRALIWQWGEATTLWFERKRCMAATSPVAFQIVLVQSAAMPLPTPLAVAIYITIWFTVLFAILPIGVRSQQEDGVVIPGTEPGAPVAPRLVMKAIVTTLVSAVLLGLLLAYMRWAD
jgi:predicted secreted protein